MRGQQRLPHLLRTSAGTAGGVDSLAAVELSSKIGRAVGLDLPSTLVFDYPSAAAIAAFIASKLSQTRSAHQHDVEAGAIMLPPAVPSAAAGQLACAERAMITVAAASRMPVDRCSDTSCPATIHDVVAVVPLDRWSVETPKVSAERD